jgi:hypothetical protein
MKELAYHPDYDPDPRLAKNFLHVGDTVLHKGGSKIVASITLTENSVLDGVEVAAAPWIAKHLFSVTLTSGEWAYGDQITQPPEDTNET